MYIQSGTCPCRLSTKAVKGNHLFPPHRREYEDCKQILKLSLPHAARSRYSPPVCHDSIPGHQVSYQRFWENRWIPDSLPTGPRPRRKPPHVDPTLIKVKRDLPSMSFFESHRRQPSITRSARLNKQRSGDFRLFPPANFANSAILPTDKISAFFMQNFLLQKPKDSSWSMPLLSPQGKNDRLRYRSAEWTLSTPWPERFQLRWHLRMRSEM